VFASIERTYTVWQAGRVNATSVYYGTMTRAQERECLQAALGALGATGGQRGDMTIVSSPDGAWPRLAWFGRDEGTVVIREGDVPLEEWIKPAGSLADLPALVRLVAAVDRSQGMWSVGLRDYGTAFTGVESTGYMLVMATPATRGERFFMATGQLEFASPEAAKQAELGAAAFAREVPSAAELGIVLTVRAEGNWLKSEITADTSKTDNATITSWLQQVLARSRARGA
jgi:hypothetical protein